ncbi:protein AGENET DOMAIN (AGD)-CONTAINING P1 [Ziziphus jujuba]|uniref:Protein AGENET DOMAIN (AGD)-CONTAINING P1 n=1 Tax=Ziziphus jujuba TaxID=326968 RepID=A0A6P3Z1X2_ZIZJJ|nr:protein AGENET DOMAIN (AGD)-CONTAINING P1 [Ziziphus jujuba]
MVSFRRGYQVEVCRKEKGFVVSYYAATVVCPLENNTYVVRYKDHLVNDESGPLIEKVLKDEVRPVPPEIIMITDLAYLDEVDAFDNDSWWVGKITGKHGSNYYVYFETTGDEIAYPLS